MAAELRREVFTSGNGWDRYYDKQAGAGVVYEHRPERRSFGFVNGVPFSVNWPNTAARYDGDSGQALGYRLRPEYDGERVTGWFLYTYMFSGDNNPHTEWVEQVA